MKNKKFKIAIVISGIFVCLLIGVIFYAASRVSPAELKKLVETQLSKTFPNANVEVGQIDFSLGTSFKFNLDKLNISLKDGEKKELFFVNGIELKVPIWAILTNGGSVDLIINQPKVQYIEFDKDNHNWKLAMKGNKAELPDAKPTEDKIKKELSDSKENSAANATVEIPAFLKRSKVNLKISNVNLHYELLSGMKGDLVLNRFLFKNLNLTSEAAYELSSNVKAQLKDNSYFATSILVIGSINTHEILNGKDIKTKLVIELNDIDTNLYSKKLPNIKTELNVLVKTNGEIATDINSAIGSVGKLSGNVQVDKGVILVKDFNTNVNIKEALLLAPMEISGLDPQGAELNLKMNLKLNNGKVLNPQMEFNVAPAMKLKVSDDFELKSELKGSIKEEDVVVTLLQKFLDGNIDTHIKTKVDFNELANFSMNKLKPINIDITAINLGLKKEVIRKIMYSPKVTAAKPNEKEAASTNAKVATNEPVNNNGVAVAGATPSTADNSKQVTKGPPLTLPPVKTNIKWSGIKIGEEIFSGDTVINVNQSTVATDGIKFKFSKGEGNISFLLNFLENQGSSTQLNFKLQDLNLDALNAFLPPMLENIKGNFSGNVKGKVLNLPYQQKLNYDFLVDVNATKGLIKGLNITEHVTGVVNSISMLKGKLDQKTFKFDDEFETLKLNGQFTDQIYKINDFKFIGLKNSADITGKGEIYPVDTTKKGVVVVDFIDKTGVLSDKMDSTLGTKVLPIKLTGIGFLLKPDYGYTLEILAKKAFAKNKDKIKEKVTEKVVEQVNKQLEKKMDSNLEQLKKDAVNGDKKQLLKKLKSFF